MKSMLLSKLFLFLFLMISYVYIFGPDFILKYNYSLDWPKEIRFNKAIHDSIIIYKNIPSMAFNVKPYYIENFYYLFFNPEVSVISIWTLVYIFINNLFLSFHITFIISIFIGFMGLCLLFEYLKINKLLHYVFMPSILFNGYIISHLSVGHPNWMSWYYVPLSIYLLFKSLDSYKEKRYDEFLKYMYFSSVFNGLIFYGGNQHNWLMNSVAAFLVAAVIPRGKQKIIITVTYILLNISFTSLKFLPAVQLIGNYLSPHNIYLSYREIWQYLCGLNYGDWERDFFLGYGACLLIVISFVLKGGGENKYSKIFLILITAFIIVSFCPYNNICGKIPVMKTQGVRSRWFSMSVFFLMLLSAGRVSNYLNKGKKCKFLIFAIIASAALFNIYSIKSKFNVYGKYWEKEQKKVEAQDLILWPNYLYNMDGDKIENNYIGKKGELIFNELPDGRGLIFNELPYSRYRLSLKIKNSKIINYNNKIMFIDKIDKRKTIKIKYSYYYEKFGLSLFLLLNLPMLIVYMWLKRNLIKRKLTAVSFVE